MWPAKGEIHKTRNGYHSNPHRVQTLDFLQIHWALNIVYRYTLR